MSKNACILLVEDDIDLGNVLCQYLKMNKYEVDLYRSGIDGLNAFSPSRHVVCLLDVMLPGMDGFALAEAIKNKSADTPFIFLTARSLKEDVLKGLKLGADDYITKPFEPEELLLRISNILKRAGNAQANVCKIGRYEFSFDRYRLVCGDIERTLTAREAELLQLLIDNKNRVVKRSDILKTVWGEDDFFLGRSMDVFITRLRKYLKHDKRIYIQSVRGVGIMLGIKG